MTRLARVVKGFGALVVLLALVVGVPWALVHFVGWPLPHRVPTAAQVGRALDRQGIPAQALVDALAVVVWCTWAVLVTSLGAEVAAARSGRPARRLPLAGALQPLAAGLVAAVLVAAVALAPRSEGTGAVPLRAGLVGARPRPVAALVVADVAPAPASIGSVSTAPVAATGAVATSPSPPPTGPAPAAATPPAAAVPPTTYVVQRGDTLWGIAERELGDPLRWSEIFAMNEGRPQPGGATLTDPHWIDPGWTLLLPASTGGSGTTVPGAGTPAPPPAPPGPSVPTPSPATQPASPAPPATPSAGPSGSPTPRPPAASHREHEEPRATAFPPPVGLPSGSVVGGSFVAGVLSAVAVGRLRRRHAYRYRPPEPGRQFGPDPLRPTLRRLTEARNNQGSPDEPPPPVVPVLADDDASHRERPDLVEVGTRRGETVMLALSELGGVALCGPAAASVVAAWVTAVVARAGPLAAEVVTTRDALARLAGDELAGRPGGLVGVQVAASAEHVLRRLESASLARARQLEDVGLESAVALRQAHPWEPMPGLVAVLDHLSADAGRWAPVVAAGRRLGLAVVVLGDSAGACAACLEVGPDRVVVVATPDELAERVRGAELFGMSQQEAADVLWSLAEAEERPDSTGEAAPAEARGSLAADGDGSSDGIAPAAATPSDPWPEMQVSSRDDGAGDLPPVEMPIAVRLFGPYEIEVGGEVVTTGLRGAARELLAWFCLRPEGASVEGAVDALWPDTDPDRVHKRFWAGAASLRTRLGTAAEPETRVLAQAGSVYRLDRGAVGCDLWRFQDAFTAAARATDDEAARAALRRAVEEYRGELLAGCDYPWVEPVRQDLHRRAIDAHLRLAELEAAAGAPAAAEAVLEQAIERDRYAEEPYRRLMALQAEQGRQDALAATWRLLQRRLAEIDVDPEPATARLYRSLSAPEPGAPAGAHRLGSPR